MTGSDQGFCIRKQKKDNGRGGGGGPTLQNSDKQNNKKRDWDRVQFAKISDKKSPMTSPPFFYLDLSC